MDRLSLGDKLVAGGGIVYFILSFIGGWAKVEFEGGLGIPGVSQSFNAWDAYGIFLKLSLIIALVYAVVVLVEALTDVELPDVPPIAHVVAGGIVAVLFLLTLVVGPDEAGAGAFGIEVSRGIVFFISILPVAALGYGSYLKMGEDTGAAPAMGGTTPAAPPPPPTA